MCPLPGLISQINWILPNFFIQQTQVYNRVQMATCEIEKYEKLSTGAAFHTLDI